MLRWCQKTYQILDNSTLIANSRYHLPSTQHAPIARTAGQIPLLNSAALSSNPKHKASFTTVSPRFAAKNDLCSVKAHHCTIDPTVSLISGRPSSTPELSSPKLHNVQPSSLRLLLPWHQPDKKEIIVVDIVKTYRRLSKQKLLNHLDENDFSNLIAFFGHLNHHSSVEDQYSSPYAKSVQQRGKKNLRILFLLEVSRDMQRHKLPMSERDKYWMMRTHLLDLEGARSPDISFQKLGQARMFYQQLEYPNDIVAQVEFLNYLAHSNQSTLVQEALNSVCEFFKQPISAPKSLVRMFCSTILSIGSELPPASKEQICSSLSLRLDQQRHADDMPRLESVPQVADISHLASSLVHAVFHSSSSAGSPFLADWSHFHCQQSFSSSLPLEQRWDNLTLLAMHCHPTSSSPPVPTEINDPHSMLWRTSFILDALHSHLGNSGLSSEQLALVKELARGSWFQFTSTNSEHSPLDVIRVFVSAFLNIAATTFSEGLRQQCLAYLRKNRLLDFSIGSRQQALQLCSGYLQAYLSCEGQNWSEIGTLISNLCPDQEFEGSLSNILLRHYVDSNLTIASNLYFFSKQRGTDLDSQLIYDLALRSIAQQQWLPVSHILRDTRLPRRVIEQVFTATLRHFQVNRLEYGPPSLIKLLGEQAISMYDQNPVPPSAKYPLRYLFGLMVTAHSALLVNLIRSVRATTPDLFSPHLIDRLVSGITRRRQLEQAAALVELFSDSPSSSMSALRSKTVVRAAEKGASYVARQLSSPPPSTHTPKTSRSSRLTRAIRFGTFPRTPNQIKRVLSILSEVGNTPAAICRGIGMLVKAKKMYLARKLMREKAAKLDPKTRTTIGNMILHAPMGRLDLRNGRLVRYVLRTKDLLMEGYGFVPDRATLNIIVKAVLRWQGMVDAPQVRKLFDQMVHEGYPVSEHWRKKHGVPFGTPPGINERVALPSLAPHISFAKHTRPLYKLFIKAFYLRHDVSAAKTVIGILKEVEVGDIREREKRNSARREGIIKKRKRETKVLQESNTSTLK